MVNLHPSCGLDTQPEWVLFNEFVLTTRPYIRTVTDVRPEWLLELAANYCDVPALADGETKSSLLRVLKKSQVNTAVKDNKRPKKTNKAG